MSFTSDDGGGGVVDSTVSQAIDNFKQSVATPDLASPSPTDFQQSEMQYNPPQTLKPLAPTVDFNTGATTGPFKLGQEVPPAIPPEYQNTPVGQFPQSLRQQMADYSARQFLSQQVQQSVPLQQAIQSGVIGTPHMSDLQAAAQFASIPFQVTAGLLKPATAPVTSRIDQMLPSALQGPAETAGNLAAGAPAMLIPGVGQLGLAGMVLGGADVTNQVRQGQMSIPDAAKVLGVQAAPILIGEALKLGIPLTKDAIANFARSDRGQTILARAQTLPQAETGGGTFGGPPEEPTSFSSHLTPEQEQAAIQGQMENRLLGLRPPAGPEGNAPEPPASAGGANLPAPPESLASRLGPTAAEREAGPTGAPNLREQGISKEAQTLENISRTPQEVAQEATARGASPQDAQSLQRALAAADFATRTPDGLLDTTKIRQTLARWNAERTGSLPGQPGQLAEIEGRLGEYLYKQKVDAMPGIIRADHLITRDMGKLDNQSQATVYEHPEEFPQLKQDTLQAIQQAAKDGPKYALLQATDPTSAPAVKGNYLAQVYERTDTSPLAPPVRARTSRGEVPVAERRAYPDRRVAIQNGETLKDMTLPQLYEYSMRRTNQGVQDAFFRKTMLENFATTDKVVAKENGWRAITNDVFTRPEEGPWYAPDAVRNMIDRKYAAAPTWMMTGERLAGIGKGILTTPGDIGGIFGRLKNLTIQRPEQIGIAAFRDLVLRGSDPAQEAQYALDGLKGARGGSLAAESGIVPGLSAYSRIMGAPWEVLGKLSEYAHEGNMMIGKALGADFSPDTARGIANRAASADDVNIVRMASRGAQVESRNTLERLTFLSQQTTRSLFSRVGQIANLIKPSSTPYQRFLAAQGLVHWTIATWGMASLVRVVAGGTPAPFPISWDGKNFKYNSDWYMAKVGKYSIPMTADLALGNALIKSATVLADAAANPGANSLPNVLGEAVKPFGQMAVGRFSPIANLIPAGAGIGYTPQGRFSTRLTAGQRLLSALPEPISASRIAENPSVLTDPAGLVQEQLLGGFPPSDSYFQARDAMTKANFPAYVKGPPSSETFRLSDAQQKAIGFSGSTLGEQRADFVDQYTGYYTTHDAKGNSLKQPVSDAEAKRVASEAFSARAHVKSVQADLTKAEHQWAYKNPYVLVQAVESGAIVPDAYEKQLVAWARTNPQAP